ncbi:LysR substrate-binding domain-containing protein [Phenylobacterium immobile]|uniref:LysR substrate-binding domain-containing protein n=1 Tax=Phenylobacterium immobile TaxID=21 RepID=UPI000A7921D1|nr:LysR substrate-binding domain-containing protein [Phenylobacterium immobile]
MRTSHENPNGAAHILAALPAFEAAARLVSFTRAARELGLTQSGLSRRISTLERWLGAPLFTRRGRAIALTEDGLRFAATAGETIRQLEQARAAFGAGLQGAVRVGALPSIGGLWLAPRLPRFLAVEPEVTVSVVTIGADFSDAPKDPVTWDPSAVDVALTWGRGGWRPLQTRALLAERMTPVCAPGVLAGLPGATLADLAAAPRLGHSSRQDAWAGYFASQGAPAPPSTPRVDLEHFFMLREAARAGAGVSLMPLLFAEDDLAAGRLVAAWPVWTTGGGYAVVGSAAALSRPAVAAFVRWLEAEAGDA